MTILSICQNAALELGITYPSTVVTSSTGTTDRRLLAFAHRTGKDLRSSYDWVQLQKEYTITLVAGQAEYALPADFDQQLFRTHWDRNNHWELLGPLSPTEWQQKKSGITTTSPRRRFRVKGLGTNKFFVDPTPSTGDAGAILVFEYSSTSWVSPVIWTESTVFAANTYCAYNGNIYKTTAGGTTGSTAPTHTTGTVTDGGILWAYQDIGYDQFRADTDFSVIDEKVVELGVIWRFLEASGLNFEQKKAEFDEAAKKEVTALSGARTLSLVPVGASRSLGFWAVPDSGIGS